MLNLITTERLVQKYGTHHDGIYIWNGEKRIGFISDLRQQFLKDAKSQSSEGVCFSRPKVKPFRRGQANTFGPNGENKF